MRFGTSLLITFPTFHCHRKFPLHCADHGGKHDGQKGSLICFFGNPTASLLSAKSGVIRMGRSGA